MRSCSVGSILPAEAGYDKARRVETADHELPVSVRGGGRSAAGMAVCNDGLEIDLLLMKAIEVNAAARTADVQGGALWRDLDCATQAFGLAVPVARIPKWGLQVDSRRRNGGRCGFTARRATICWTPKSSQRMADHSELIPDLRGQQPVVAIAACYAGPMDRAETEIYALARMGHDRLESVVKHGLR